jgi:hypothetical protein
MFDLAVVRVFPRHRIIDASAVSPYGRAGTTRPEWFCAIETQPAAADLFAMKTLLIVFLFTFAPGLCVAQPDSARGLDFPSRMRFTCLEKVRQCIPLGLKIGTRLSAIEKIAFAQSCVAATNS